LKIFIFKYYIVYMGNILTSPNGNRLLPDTITASSINDMLLELDLYNKEKSVAPVAAQGKPRLIDPTVPFSANNPYISEIDFTTNGFSVLNIINPKSPTGFRRDGVYQIPYKSNDVYNSPTGNHALPFSSENDSNNWQLSDIKYNIKRNFCNSSANVPVNIAGVDLPTDKKETIASITLNPSTNRYVYNTIPTTGTLQSNYNNVQLPHKVMSYDTMNNCLKYGDINGNAGYYMIDLTPKYFYNQNKRFLDKHENSITGSSSSVVGSLIVVDRLSPIYLPLTSNGPIATSSMVNTNNLIQVGYIPDNILSKYIQEDKYVGFYAEPNPSYNSAITYSLQNTVQQSNNSSPVILYPLIITSTGQTFATNTCVTTNKADYILSFLNPTTSGIVKPFPSCSGLSQPSTPIMSSSINDVITSYLSTPSNAPTSGPTSGPSSGPSSSPSISLNTIPKSTDNRYLIKVGMVPTLQNINVINKPITLPNELNYAIFLKTKITQIPTIPDDVINDATLGMTKTTLNDLAKQTVYGTVMTDECNRQLNNLLTNSYINTNLSQYSKLTDILDPSLVPTISTVKSLLSSDNTISQYKLTTSNTDPTRQIIKIVTAATAGVDYGIKQGGTLVNNQNAQVTNACGSFYDNMCNYYYYYDKKDGIIHNDTLNALINTNQNLNSYNQNLQYLTHHVPDCRCKIPSLDTAGTPTPLDVGKLYDTNTCFTKNSTNSVGKNGTNYGINPGNINGVNPTAPNITNVNPRLYNDAMNISSDMGFRAQQDPIYTSTSGLKDNQFIYAGDARADSNFFNNYTCNISQVNNISNVAGNVSISDVSLSCNFGSVDTLSKTLVATNPMTSMSVTYRDELTLNRYSLNDTTFTTPMPYMTKLIVDITWNNIAYPNGFISPANYGFAFYPASNLQTKKTDYVMTNFDCNGSVETTAADGTFYKSCDSPSNVLVPFVYGLSYNPSIEYYLELKSFDTNKVNFPKRVSVYLPRYSMVINNLTPTVTSNNLALTISVLANGSPRINNLPYLIEIKPTIAINSDGTKNEPIGIDGTKFWEDFNIDSTGNGSKQLINNGSNISFNNTQYSVSIQLGQMTNFDGTRVINDPVDINNMYYSTNFNSTNMPYLQLDGISPSRLAKVDFSNVISRFTQAGLSYYDYNNGNTLKQYSITNTGIFAATASFSYTFVSINNNYDIINFYYDIPSLNTNKVPLNTIIGSSGNPVPSNLVPTLNNPDTYTFIMPLFTTATTILVYAEVSSSSTLPTLSSVKISVTVPTIPTTLPNIFGGYLAIPNLIITNSTNITTPQLSVVDYIKNNSFKMVQFNPNRNSWVYSNADLSPAAGSSNIYDTTKLANNTSSLTNAILFIKPYISTTIAFTLTDNNNNNLDISTNNTTPFKIGSTYKINWTLSAGLSSDMNMQVAFFTDSSSRLIVQSKYNFTIRASVTSGTIPIILDDNSGNPPTARTQLSISNGGTLISNLAYLNNITNDIYSYVTLPTDTGTISYTATTPQVYIDINNKSTADLINLNENNPQNNYAIVYKNVPVNGVVIDRFYYKIPLTFSYTDPLVLTFNNIIAQPFTNYYSTSDIYNIKNRIIEGLVSPISYNLLSIDLSRTTFSTPQLFNLNINSINNDTFNILKFELNFGTITIEENATLNLTFSPKSTYNVTTLNIKGKIYENKPFTISSNITFDNVTNDNNKLTLNKDNKYVLLPPPPPDPTSVTIDQSDISLLQGQVIKLTATVLPTNAISKNVIWSSSNPTVASVSAIGLVTGLVPGTVFISASSLVNQTLSSSLSIVVTKPDSGGGGGGGSGSGSGSGSGTSGGTVSNTGGGINFIWILIGVFVLILIGVIIFFLNKNKK